ncbi:hypothetical protein HGA64_04935, partial [Candidatus Falkowbacteria bacterium]|nr:hypothetical protein [Candidatus Falkowbacteria bacterium]
MYAPLHVNLQLPIAPSREPFAIAIGCPPFFTHSAPPGLSYKSFAAFSDPFSQRLSSALQTYDNPANQPLLHMLLLVMPHLFVAVVTAQQPISETLLTPDTLILTKSVLIVAKMIYPHIAKPNPVKLEEMTVLA